MSKGYPQHNNNGSFVGIVKCDHVLGKWVLEKNVDLSKHHLHTPAGWACDVEHLENLREMAGDDEAVIRLHVTVYGGQMKWLTATLDQFDRLGRRIDRGYGEQLMLPDKHWHDSSLQAKLL